MKKIIIYSIGEWVERLLSIYSLNYIEYFVDDSVVETDEKIWHGKKVFAPAKLLEEDKENILVIIGNTKCYMQISRRLDNIGLVENIHYFNGWNLPADYFFRIKNGDWISNEHQDSLKRQSWEIRAMKMASMLPEDVRSIADYGCGNQRLRKYLDESIVYYGIDYVDREEGETIICDVNKDVLPRIDVDCTYMAGFFSYIKEPEKFIEQINSKYILLSYEGRETYQTFGAAQNRGMFLFVENYMTIWEMIQMFIKNGYKLITIEGRSFDVFCLFEKDI